MEKNLIQLRKGEWGIIESLKGDDLHTLRLKESGFTPGSKISMVRKTPFGDPILFEIRGTQIALRKKEAECITLK